jgi:hypothetical protein
VLTGHIVNTLELPHVVGSSSVGFCGCFKNHWADVTLMVVTAFSIVDHLYVIEYIGTSLVAT